VFNEVIINW